MDAGYYFTPPQHILNQRDITAFYNSLDKTNNNSKNGTQYDSVPIAVCGNLLKSPFAEDRGGFPRNVHWLFRNVPPMWVFCQWAAAAVRIPEESGVKQQFLSEASFAETCCSFFFQSSTLALLVSRLQLLSVSIAQDYRHALS